MDALRREGSSVLEHGLYTVPEVAYGAGVDDKSVNREIDAKVVAPAGQSRSGERLLNRNCVLYMAAIGELRTDLSRVARLRIATLLQARSRKLTLGPFELEMSRLQALVGARLSEVDALRTEVVSDPDICGGEPVLRGTRLRIHKVAGLAAMGTSRAVFAAEYDLSPEKVATAVLFARLHPRRGRRALIRADLVEHVPARG